MAAGVIGGKDEHTKRFGAVFQRQIDWLTCLIISQDLARNFLSLGCERSYPEFVMSRRRIRVRGLLCCLRRVQNRNAGRVTTPELSPLWGLLEDELSSGCGESDEP